MQVKLLTTKLNKMNNELEKKEFDVYYTKTKDDWDNGLNIEFDTTHNCYDKALMRAKSLSKANYLVEINILNNPSKFIVVSKNNKLITLK